MVIRSSTRITFPAPRSRPPPGTTSSAPEMFASRPRAPRPAWSATYRRCRSTGTTRACRPAHRSRAAAASAIRRVGSWPRALTERREDGTGTRSSGRAARPSLPPAAASTATARAPPRGRARVSAPRSLWARSSSRTASAYGATAWTTGSPASTGRRPHPARPFPRPGQRGLARRAQLGARPAAASAGDRQHQPGDLAPPPPHGSTVRLPERPGHPCGNPAGAPRVRQVRAVTESTRGRAGPLPRLRVRGCCPGWACRAATPDRRARSRS